MTPKKILHVYCRVSSETQVKEGHSLEAQQLAGKRKAEQLSFDEYKVYVEPGQSAKDDNTTDRPVLKELLKLCDKGEVTDIFVVDLDRLSRNLMLVLKLKPTFAANNIVIHTNSSSINFNSGEQEFFALLLALMAQRENSLKSERSIRGMNEAVRKGRWIGKMMPYGYKKDVNRYLAVDAEESEVYITMVRWCLSGDGTTTIARKLNALNIPTRGKKVLLNGTHFVNRYTKKVRHVTNEEFQWRDGTVYSILTNPIYIGRRRYKGEIISAPSIIDENTWQLVQEQLKKNRNVSRNHTNSHFYLLKGLIRCGKCGANFYGKIKSDERIYMCSSKRTHSCGIRSINLDRLNSLLWHEVINSGAYTEQLKVQLNTLGTDTAIRNTERDIATLNSELQVLDGRLEKLVELYELGRLTISKYDERYQEIKKQQELLKTQLHSIEQKRLALDNVEGETDKMLAGLFGLWQIKEQLDKLGNEEKRSLLLRLNVNIIINWDSDKKCHNLEITFTVNSLKYEVKKNLKKGTSLEPRKPFSFLLDSADLIKSFLKPHSALQLHITEQAR